jgi:hypothetical protein
MALVGSIIGLPMFFEIGLVLASDGDQRQLRLPTDQIDHRHQQLVVV